jgi:hypothetical protein
MSRRSLFCGLAALALAVWAAGPVSAEDHTHEGKVVKVDGSKLTMTDKDGKEHSHDVGATAKVMHDGKEIKLADLKAGQAIEVTMDKATKAVTKIEVKKAE